MATAYIDLVNVFDVISHGAKLGNNLFFSLLFYSTVYSPQLFGSRGCMSNSGTPASNKQCDEQEFVEIMRGATVEVLGKCTTEKRVGERKIHTVPILISCGCKNVKGRLERIVRNAGLVASFQWLKECMEFVEKIREKVEAMGFGRKEYYTRVRPVTKEGRVLLRADTKKKEGGKFEGLAYWRAPPMDKEYWSRINSMLEPERRIVKQVESIGL